jgi:hypothetical protein
MVRLARLAERSWITLKVLTIMLAEGCFTGSWVILMEVALGLKRKNRKSLINDQPQGVNWLQYYKKKEVL